MVIFRTSPAVVEELVQGTGARALTEEGVELNKDTIPHQASRPIPNRATTSPSSTRSSSNKPEEAMGRMVLVRASLLCSSQAGAGISESAEQGLVHDYCFFF